MFLPPPRTASELPNYLLYLHRGYHRPTFSLRGDQPGRLQPDQGRMEPRPVGARQMHTQLGLLLRHVHQQHHHRSPPALAAHSDCAAVEGTQYSQARTGGHVLDGVPVSVAFSNMPLSPRLTVQGHWSERLLPVHGTPVA